MFLNLLKYEFKSIRKWYFVLNASILVLSLFLGISISNYNSSYGYYNSGRMEVFLGVMMLAIGCLVTGIFVTTIVILIRRFYSSVFGREGYLIMTLPVSTNQVILSNLLVSLIWTLFNFLTMILSLMLVFLPLLGTDLADSLSDFLHSLDGAAIYTMFLVLFNWIISILASCLLLYLCISIGNLFHNNRFLMMFLSYFGITLILGLVSIIHENIINYSEISIFSNIFYYDSSSMLPYYNHMIYYSIFGNITKGILFYAATYHIINNKFNIQ